MRQHQPPAEVLRDHCSIRLDGTKIVFFNQLKLMNSKNITYVKPVSTAMVTVSEITDKELQT